MDSRSSPNPKQRKELGAYAVETGRRTRRGSQEECEVTRAAGSVSVAVLLLMASVSEASGPRYQDLEAGLRGQIESSWVNGQWIPREAIAANGKSLRLTGLVTLIEGETSDWTALLELRNHTRDHTVAGRVPASAWVGLGLNVPDIHSVPWNVLLAPISQITDAFLPVLDELACTELGVARSLVPSVTGGALVPDDVSPQHVATHKISIRYYEPAKPSPENTRFLWALGSADAGQAGPGVYLNVCNDEQSTGARCLEADVVNEDVSSAAYGGSRRRDLTEGEGYVACLIADGLPERPGR